MIKKRLPAILCVACLIMPQVMVTGCSKNKKNEKEIYSADTPWYTVTECNALASRESIPEGATTYNGYIGRTDDSYIFLEEVDEMIPEEEAFDPAARIEYSTNSLVFIDGTGEVTKRIDLQSLVADSGVLDQNVPEYYFGSEMSYVDDSGIVLDFTYYNGDFIYNRLIIDPETDQIVEMKERERLDGYITYPVKIGSFGVMEYCVDYESNLCTLSINVYDTEGNSHVTDLNTVLPGVEAYEMYEPIVIDEYHSIAKLKTVGQSDPRWIEINRENGSISEYTGDLSFLDGIDMNNISYSEEFATICLDIDGIKKIDVEAGTIEEIFSFDWCNINRSVIKEVELIDMTEDQLYLYVTRMYTSGYRSFYDNDILRLDKCESNPNVGKTILDVAYLGEISDHLAQSICDFNETNPDYYIRYRGYYDLTDYSDFSNIGQAARLEDMDMEIAGYLGGDGYDPSLNEFVFDAESNMSNELIMDMLSGEGPDIILGGMTYTQLDRDDYLIDMSQYYTDSQLPCFDNIIDACRTDGKLYQMPLTFTLSGIVASNDGLADGQCGFTFDQYATYVDQTCNGFDPMIMNRLDFLTAVIMSQRDVIITGDEVNFDNEEFREAAQYANDHVFDIVDPEAIYEEHGDDKRDILSLYTTLLWSDFYTDYSYVGIPSANGRGPVANIEDSVAITAQSASPEGCWEFVEFLLSPSQQVNLADNSMTVNTDAFVTASEADLEEYREYYDFWDESERAMMRFTEPDARYIDDLRDIVMSADRINSTDTTIMIIMREEVQAYFAGDKTLDEVIEVINSRARLYLDERN